MALKALLPIGIMTVALGTMGTFAGGVGKKRQYVEHSYEWETALKEIYGVIPPRTRVDPFIAPLHPALVERKIPIYHSGALLSQIVPGGPHDPYANPLPTREQFEEENKRLDAFVGIKPLEGAAKREADAEAAEERAGWQLANKQAREARNRELAQYYRDAPMAEFYRMQAYQALHPELKVDLEKVKGMKMKERFLRY